MLGTFALTLAFAGTGAIVSNQLSDGALGQVGRRRGTRWGRKGVACESTKGTGEDEGEGRRIHLRPRDRAGRSEDRSEGEVE